MGQLRLGSRPSIAKTVLAINHPVPEFGGLWIDDTSLHSPTATTTSAGLRGWAQVYVATATVFNAATKTNISGIAGKTVPAGTWLYGNFSQIQLTSGSVIAYYGTEQ